MIQYDNTDATVVKPMIRTHIQNGEKKKRTEGKNEAIIHKLLKIRATCRSDKLINDRYTKINYNIY